MAKWPANDSRHGMPTGLDETDMWWAGTATNRTELPFVSIATEMWRGFQECGEALVAIAESNRIDTDSHLHPDNHPHAHPENHPHAHPNHHRYSRPHPPSHPYSPPPTHSPTTSYPPSVIARLKNVSRGMLELAPTLLTTIRRSMAMDVTPTNVSGGPRLDESHP